MSTLRNRMVNYMELPPEEKGILTILLTHIGYNLIT